MAPRRKCAAVLGAGNSPFTFYWDYIQGPITGLYRNDPPRYRIKCHDRTLAAPPGTFRTRQEEWTRRTMVQMETLHVVTVSEWPRKKVGGDNVLLLGEGQLTSVFAKNSMVTTLDPKRQRRVHPLPHSNVWANPIIPQADCCSQCPSPPRA